MPHPRLAVGQGGRPLVVDMARLAPNRDNNGEASHRRTVWVFVQQEIYLSSELVIRSDVALV